MAKTNNLHIRIDPEIQKKAEKVLRKLGMSIPDAITIFLNQVGLRGGLPFEVTLPEEQGERYFYGVELPELSYDPKESFEYLTQKMATPSFKEKCDKWLNSAIALSKNKLGDKWDESFFWCKVFSNDPDYGAFDSFANLFKGYGLKLEYCYWNTNEHGLVPPYVAGVHLTSQEEKRLANGEKPKSFLSLCRKFRGIIAKFKEDDLEVFEVYDEETEEMMGNIYDPNDPNFMTSDDY